MKRRLFLNIMLTIFISLCIVLLNVFIFNKSWLRLFESFGDLIGSVEYFFYRMMGRRNVPLPSVTRYSTIFDFKGFLPDSWVKFETFFSDFFSMFFNAENFSLWGRKVLRGFMVFAKYLIVVIPVFLLIGLIIKKLRERTNNNYNKDTIFLKWYKKISALFVPVIRVVKDYITFIKENKWIYILWCIAIAIMLNFGCIIVSLFAFYFYFCVTFDFANLWVQFGKLIIDLQVVIKAIPVWCWLIIAYVVLCNLRKKRALNKLRHMEAKNCGFIKDLPIVAMTNGTMGKKKTTMITDMALSQEVMIRQKAFEILQNNDVKFQRFPWICFELEIRKCMEFRSIYNLATIKAFVDKKKERFYRNKEKSLQLYGYDYERYGLKYNNGLYDVDLFEILEIYGKAYFIYIIESSLIVSNYSIREDNEIIDSGNFPMWAMDFFPEVFRENNRHAHILDFDTLRLGKKVIENNKNAGSFEFGVVVITEIGKERGNNLELKEIKKQTEEANQKNDLFNSWLKMCRHSATVDNFPFIKVFTDEQRPESWGADARDLCDVIKITDSGMLRLAMPFYTIEEMITEFVCDKFYNAYYDFRFRRGDNTLFMYLFKGLASWLFSRNLRVYNKYGYSVLKVEKESGTMDGKKRKKSYYIMNMKTYRKRFITDCFGDYFNELAKGSVVGLKDYIEYKTEKASVEELKLQNSYFINSLYGDSNANSIS